jgi:hypothetical protein
VVDSPPCTCFWLTVQLVVLDFWVVICSAFSFIMFHYPFSLIVIVRDGRHYISCYLLLSTILYVKFGQPHTDVCTPRFFKTTLIGKPFSYCKLAQWFAAHKVFYQRAINSWFNYELTNGFGN